MEEKITRAIGIVGIMMKLLSEGPLKFAFILLGMIIIIIGLFFYFSPYVTSDPPTENYEVPAGSELTCTRLFEEGDSMDGYFTVFNGNEDIVFYVKDPYGATILDAGVVTNRHDFAFTTEHTGMYSVHFNNWSPFNKTVFFTAKIRTKIFFYDYCLQMVLFGSLVLVLGLACIYVNKRKKKENVGS